VDSRHPLWPGVVSISSCVDWLFEFLLRAVYSAALLIY
jgi:hypothetical protein